MDHPLAGRPDPLAGRLLDGRYRVGPRIARGGMATVYEALDVRLDRLVALKVMHPQLAEDHAFVDRFIGEARSAARLSHPDVVAVYDQGADGDVVYLVMEYVRGRNLRQLLRDRGRLPHDTALELMEPVLAALSAAHAAGIVHRDVKPENVLLGNDGRVKVADFGLARAVTGGASLTRGLLLGTVAYIAPEQALGEPATPASDVYAAGIMLSELLTGSAPHTGATDFVVVRAHIEHDVPAPSASVPTVPAAVDQLVLRATRRNPAQRFPDAGAFLAGVRRVRALERRGTGAPLQVEPLESAGVSAADAMAVLAAGGVLSAEAAGGSDATLTATRGAETGGHQDRSATAIIGARTGRIDTVPGAGAGSRRRRGSVAFVMTLLLAAALAGGGWWVGAGRYVATPGLLQLRVAEAEARAAELGLDVVVDDERRHSETVAAGLVLETDPGPGERVLRGGTVTVVLSAGPQRYPVPDVVGSARAEAERALEGARLVVGRVSGRYDDEAPEGRVIEQGRPAGEQVRAGTAVDLVVSKGPEPIKIPDVTGRPIERAQQILAEAGFVVFRADDEFSDTVPAGRVIRQNPDSGTGTRGDEIRLVVSKGPDVVDVPDVDGRPLAEARAELEARGLKVREVVLLPAGPGTVLRQSPRAGTQVRRGSEVTLYVF